jgi:uncharacterized protein
MNDDPESLNTVPAPGDPGRESAAPEPVPATEPLHGTAQILSWPAPHDPLATMQPTEPVPVVPPPPRLIPNIGHFLVFLALIIPATIGGYLLTILVIFASDPRGGIRHLFARLSDLTKTKDLLFAISMQGALYIVLWGLAALVFGLWWQSVAGEGFLRGIQWNASAARRRILLLAIAGVATGFLITIAGNFVPMPKTAPILEDITTSRAGAWVLMVFGVTLAPLTEELAFRGFLLPGLINIFRWIQRKGAISESVVSLAGVPVCIVLTSIPFALMHAEQVSDSWGPVLLIGCVSIILCVVRLQMRSVAAGVMVHSFYNLTLFTGLFIQSDGFRHLDKLKV